MMMLPKLGQNGIFAQMMKHVEMMMKILKKAMKEFHNLICSIESIIPKTTV
jgi:hypothetical protein